MFACRGRPERAAPLPIDEKWAAAFCRMRFVNGSGKVQEIAKDGRVKPDSVQ
jgi:hypothetical protein